MILFENKHNTWLIPPILLKHQCKSSFIQNYTKIKICVFIAVKYTTRISIRMLANLYKRHTITKNLRTAIDKNGLRLLPNMLRICVFTNFRNMFLKFAKPRERPRMFTNSNECQANTLRPLRFVNELLRCYVNEPIRNIFAQVTVRAV